MPRDRVRKVEARKQDNATLILQAVVRAHTADQSMHSLAVLVLPNVRAIWQAYGPQVGEERIIRPSNGKFRFEIHNVVCQKRRGKNYENE